jgi:aspartate/methionine/tyrosine aminotransferase
MTIEEKFKSLESKNAPGQEIRQNLGDLNSIMLGDKLDGIAVDFSHGDVDAFPPIPDSDISWKNGFSKGSSQAYTEYRGSAEIRNRLAISLGKFTGKVIKSDSELIITPGTQGALFLALGATVTLGTKVAVIEPDYFANRKLVKFFGGEVVPIPLNYKSAKLNNSPDLNIIEEAFKNNTKVFVFSTPNNPTGIVYSKNSIKTIGNLAVKYGVTVIVDQLYSRMLFSAEVYTHLRSCDVKPENLITIMGPSKTESLSGFRLGVAFGSAHLIERMESLQAIVSLRTAGYNQAVLDTWFHEPEGWMENRIHQHELIRDELLKAFRSVNIYAVTPQAGSYLFPQLPSLCVDLHTFVRLLRYQANVIVTPGSEFDPKCKDSIRLNFSQNRELAVLAVKRIIKMVEIYKI